MKFLADMPLSPKTVQFLKNMGQEAVRVSELGMSKSKDRDIFDSLLFSNISSIEEEMMKGAIVIIEDSEIRIRELPIG